jgi:AcrR family transcriptional regulator
MPAQPDPALTARVLAAARALAARRGEAWSMAELAREAGVARSSLLRRFAGRDDVLAALVDGDAAAQARPPSSRTRALDAFHAVARRKGLAATTLEDVAAEAGLGVATVYRQFGGRRGLLDAYADERTPRAKRGLLRADDGGSPRDVLQAVAVAMIEHLVADGPLLLLAPPADPEAQRMLGHLRRLEARSRAELRRWFTRTIARGSVRGDPAALTDAFVGMVAGSVLLAAAAPVDPPQLAADLVSLFLRGCAPRPSSVPRERGA